MPKFMAAPQALGVEMPDGSLWAVPVLTIAKNRAEYYKDRDLELGGDLDKALADTLAFFENPSEIYEWAMNNMNWDDVEKDAVKVCDRAPLTDFDKQDGWMDGDKSWLDTMPEVTR